jgi:hypothetical protein
MNGDGNLASSRKLLLACMSVLLPVIGFSAIWANTHLNAQKGVDWDVPVEGYDPRDLLRGHYITFQYDWPGLKQDEKNRWNPPDIICLEGKAPLISQVTVLQNYPGNSMPKCATVARFNKWSNDAHEGLGRDSIFIPQNDSQELADKLNDAKLQAVVRIRVGEDGYIRPLEIKFRPRPAGKQNENGFNTVEDVMSAVSSTGN